LVFLFGWFIGEVSVSGLNFLLKGKNPHSVEARLRAKRL
jgi:hypothetical protein